MIYADYAPDPSNGREWVRKAFAPVEREPLWRRSMMSSVPLERADCR